MNYAAINYNDPITVGIGQWYGTRAAALINKMKNVDSAGYGALPQDFRNVMNAHDKSDAFWNTYYLPRNFGDALKPFLLNNRNIQDDQLILDANSPIETWRSSTESTLTPTPRHSSYGPSPTTSLHSERCESRIALVEQISTE